MSRIIREAQPSDMADIMRVMDAAKKIMRQSGNMHQWGDGYPSEGNITADMERGGGFVIADGDQIVGYFAFLPSPEPTYDRIYEGKWLDDERSYHVVHRIASDPEAHTLFSDIMDFCFSHDPNIRIDTHRGINYENIEYIERLDEEKNAFGLTNTFRWFGAAGVFGYIGWFHGKGIGTFMSYVTDPKKAFLIHRKKGKPVAISVSEPDEFMPFYLKGGEK